MEPDRAHANRCALAVMCLREYFHTDIIRLIVSICWELRSKPVFALFTSIKSGYVDSAGHSLHDKWEDLKRNIPKIHPQLNLRHIKCREIRTITPSSSNAWYYKSLFIPGWIWDTIASDCHFVDSEMISCDSLNFNIINHRGNYGRIYSDSSDLMPSSVSNQVQILSHSVLWTQLSDHSKFGLTSILNSFMNIQNTIAF